MADGNIVAARQRLTDAVKRLCDPRTLVHYNHVLTGPSLYQLLGANLAGRQGETRTPAQSLPPVWIDPTQLLMEIDAQVRLWRPATRASTPQRLAALADRAWRPQDSDHVTDMARRISGWCESISGLLDPESRKFITADCPSCGRSTVHKRDTAGEVVRQPALVVVASVGASCQACQAHWAPDRYLFLCRLLGFELPEGVLE